MAPSIPGGCHYWLSGEGFSQVEAPLSNSMTDEEKFKEQLVQHFFNTHLVKIAIELNWEYSFALKIAQSLAEKGEIRFDKNGQVTFKK